MHRRSWMRGSLLAALLVVQIGLTVQPVHADARRSLRSTEFGVFADTQLDDRGFPAHPDYHPLHARPDSIAACIAQQVRSLPWSINIGDITESSLVTECRRYAEMFRGVNVIEIPGNHDHYDMATYRAEFGWDTVIEIVEGPVQLVLIDTSEFSATQAASDLFAARADDPSIVFRILAGHHQARSNNTRNGRVAPGIALRLDPIMEQWGVDLYLSGHGHAGEHHVVHNANGGRGRHYVVAGGAGGIGSVSGKPVYPTDEVRAGGTLVWKTDRHDYPYRGNHYGVIEAWSDGGVGELTYTVYNPDGTPNGYSFTIHKDFSLPLRPSSMSRIKALYASPE